MPGLILARSQMRRGSELVLGSSVFTPLSGSYCELTFVVGTAATRLSDRSKSRASPASRVSEVPSSAAPLADSILEPGMRFGPYRLIRRLGSGAQGDVWKVRRHHPRSDIIALKVLSPALAKLPHRLAQFRREAERGAKLAGPSLLPIFEFGEIEGVHYMTMPLVEGTTLQQVIKRRRAHQRGQTVHLVHPLVAMEQELYVPAAARALPGRGRWARFMIATWRTAT